MLSRAVIVMIVLGFQSVIPVNCGQDSTLSTRIKSTFLFSPGSTVLFLVVIKGGGGVVDLPLRCFLCGSYVGPLQV